MRLALKSVQINLVSGATNAIAVMAVDGPG